MYPGFIAEYDDQSDITTLPISTVRNQPLFGAVFTSDKGTEAWTRISGEDFFKMYGKNISFARHGQPLLQAAMSINAGAELLCKRLVSDDACLANIGIVATLSSAEEQKVDADGNKLYIDADGAETVEVTDTAATTTVTTVKYSLKTAENVESIKEAYDAISGTMTTGQYLLYVISDIGRGVSKKRIKMVPNYRLSKSQSYTMLTLSVLENNEEVESLTFSTHNSIIVKGQNIALDSMINTYSSQLRCICDNTTFEAYTEALADAAGIDVDTMRKYDLINCMTNKGTAIDGLKVDAEGIDLQYTYGQQLAGGSNGTFGAAPIANEDEFCKQAVAALDGTFDTVIYNLDQYKLNAWVDANYPDPVKRAIEALASFREDFMYFRDQGLGKTSIDLIKAACYEETKNMFCATYPQSYDIIDPYTKRQISVTIGYDLAQLMVEHCNNGSILPTAGFKHDMVIKNAIYGTLSFSPCVCPDPVGNQKEQLDDMRVNYASYIDNELVIESLYTSQEVFTQWSFINNVMGIQDVVKAIRTRCPVIRYSFLEGEDLEHYKSDVEEVIAPYVNQFSTLELEYVQDATYSANKIFYAVLKVIYKDFVQTEWFKVTALSAVEVLA